MKCPNCGSEIPGNSKFCLECGSPVESETVPAPDTAVNVAPIADETSDGNSSTPDKAMEKAAEETAVEKESPGGNASQNTEPAIEKSGKKHKRRKLRLLLIILAVVLCLVVAGGLIWLKVNDVKSIEAPQTSLSACQGDALTLSCVVDPVDTWRHDIVWSSSDTSIATVVADPDDPTSANVQVVGTGKCEVTFSIKKGKLTITYYIAAMPAIKSLKIKNDSYILYSGEIQDCDITCKPDNAQNSIVWTSSDENVVKAGSGTLEAVSPGTCTVTASSANGKVNDTCEITVIDKKEFFNYIYQQEKNNLGDDTVTISSDGTSMTIKSTPFSDIETISPSVEAVGRIIVNYLGIADFYSATARLTSMSRAEVRSSNDNFTAIFSNNIYDLDEILYYYEVDLKFR